MERKPNLARQDSPDADFAYDQLNKLDSVVSAAECTGLMQRPPENEAEAESYNEIYVVPQVANSEEKKLRMNAGK